MTKDAEKRLSALMEHKDLGSGFQIAMKDLQIRGAGTAWAPPSPAISRQWAMTCSSSF